MAEENPHLLRWVSPGQGVGMEAEEGSLRRVGRGGMEGTVEENTIGWKGRGMMDSHDSRTREYHPMS